MEIVIVGGGVLGCSIARQLASSAPLVGLALLEKEGQVGLHASSRNSGVIHSGFNLKPGTLKASFCVEGSRRLREYCATHGIPMQQVGTLVVATDEEDHPVLRELEGRGQANKVPGVRIIEGHELRNLEPYVGGLEALYSPTGSILDSQAYVRTLAEEARRRGVQIFLGVKVTGVKENGCVEVTTSAGRLRAGLLINCAGLYADKVGHMVGAGLRYAIIPFRGEYYELLPHRTHLVRSMIYPVPNLEFPFLGIHFTKRVGGGVIVGPNAVLAPGREAYDNRQLNAQEVFEALTWTGFLRALTEPRFLEVAIHEATTSMSKKKFVNTAKRLLPCLRPEDLVPGMAGIRAQLVERNGRLVDDFVVEFTDRTVHILNAVSPGLTSSLSFADYVVNMLFEKGYLPLERRAASSEAMNGRMTS